MAPHWMTIYNGKILLHNASGGTDNNKRLIRIDAETLTLDGSINTGDNVASLSIGYNITNNNTVTPDGWIYLNPELSFERPLKRYRVEDFSISETLISTGYYSGGSLEYPVDPESLKTKLSQFGEWDKVTQSVSVNGGTPVLPDPTTGNIDLTIPDASELTLQQVTDNDFVTSNPLISDNNVQGNALTAKTGIYTGNIFSTNITELRNYELPDANGTFVISVNGNTPDSTGNVTVSGGATNLTYTAAPTYGTVNSDTGTDATIPLSDNTNAGLMPANFYVVYPETAYTETVTWGGTAPVTMQNSTWQATKVGNRLSLRMNINYATAGAGNTTAQVPLPTGVPLPSSITGFTNNNSYVVVGSGVVSTSITGNPTISRAVLRRETGTTYSVYNSFSSGAYNTIIIDIEYFTD